MTEKNRRTGMAGEHRTDRHMGRSAQARLFFGACFAVLLLMLLWNLFHCSQVSWLSREIFRESGEQEVILTDDHPLVLHFGATDGKTQEGEVPAGSKLRGISLPGYQNAAGLRFTGETVAAEAADAGSGEILGSGVLDLRNQPPYPNDDTSLYIAFSDPIEGAADRELEIRVTSSGLSRNGLSFSGGTADEEGKVLSACLYYEKKTWTPLPAILQFIVGAAACMLCMLLVRTKEYALFAVGKGNGRVVKGLRGWSRWKKAVRTGVKKGLAALVALLCLCLLTMLYTYIHVVRKAAASESACILVPLPSSRDGKKGISISERTVVRQRILAGQDCLSGFGIYLQDGEGEAITPKKEPAGSDLTISWRLYEEGGTTLLSGGEQSLHDLRGIQSMLTKETQEDEVAEAVKDALWLPLEEPVADAKGRWFLLEIEAGEKEESERGEEALFYILSTGETNGTMEIAEDGSTTEEREMCLLATYHNNGFLKGMFAKLCAAAFLFMGLLLALVCIDSDNAAVMYLVSAVCMGLLFSFMTPAFTIADERTHIDTVYCLSNTLLGITEEPGPLRAYKRMGDIDVSIRNTMPVTADRYRPAAEELFRAASAEDRKLVPAYTRNAQANAPVLCYLPAALGFTAARLLGRNLITMIMAARWMNLLACAAIIYFALRRMPVGAASMAVIALFPKTLQQMASCSYDGMMIAGSFLFIAYCLSMLLEERHCAVDVLVLMFSGFFLASCKGGAYLPLLGIVLLLPFAKAQNHPARAVRQRAWIAGTTAAGGFLLFAGSYLSRLASMFSRNSGESVRAYAGVSLYTMSDFVSAPQKLIRIFANTVYERGDGLLGELVGKNLSQKWTIVFFFLLLAFVGVLHRKPDSDPETSLSLKGRLWILFLAMCSTALIFLSMLLAFTEKGSSYIYGLQGRYFLPIAPLFSIFLENRSLSRNGLRDSVLLFAADAALTLTFFEILLNYLNL